MYNVNKLILFTLILFSVTRTEQNRQNLCLYLLGGRQSRLVLRPRAVQCAFGTTEHNIKHILTVA